MNVRCAFWSANLANGLAANQALTRIEMHVRRLENSFEMTISDDGVGFDPASERTGHGLKFMRDIAHYLGGEVGLERLPIGSLVRLTFPLSDLSNASVLQS